MPLFTDEGYPIETETAEIAEQREVMPPVKAPADDAEAIRSFTLDDDRGDTALVEIAPDCVTDQGPRTIKADFINAAVMGVRATFDAKKKRGAEYKAHRTRLDRMANQAVIAFGAEWLPELTADQVLKISLGESGLVGDSLRGFSYVEGE